MHLSHAIASFLSFSFIKLHIRVLCNKRIFISPLEHNGFDPYPWNRVRGGGSESHGKDASPADCALKPKIPPRPFFADDPLFVKIVRQSRTLGRTIFSRVVNHTFDAGLLVADLRGRDVLHVVNLLTHTKFSSNVCVTFFQNFLSTYWHFT